MLTIKQFEQYVEGLPRASHDMEHITNFGRIVAKGFVLVAATIDRCSHRITQNIVGALGGETVDTDALRAQRAKAREAEALELRKQLAALEAEAAADEGEHPAA